MASRLKRYLSFPGLAHAAYANIRLAARLLREPRVPTLLKALPILGFAYVLSPIDLLPDVLPVIGQIDDLGLMLLAIEAFKRLSPTDVVAYHAAAIASGRRYEPMSSTAPPDFIDAEWRRD